MAVGTARGQAPSARRRPGYPSVRLRARRASLRFTRRGNSSVVGRRMQGQGRQVSSSPCRAPAVTREHCRGAGSQGRQGSGPGMSGAAGYARNSSCPLTSKRFVSLDKIRVRVEHAVAGVKRRRIVKDTFRNTKDNMSDATVEVACGLHNVRVDHRKPGSKP